MEGLRTRTVKRIKSSRAFTLAEALVAVIILLLVSAIVAAGIPAAARAYERVVIASDAHVLLSTTMSSLRNEMLTAKNVEEKEGGKAVIFYNESLGTESMIYSDSDTGRIMIKRYAAKEVIEDAEDSTPQPLVSDEASDYDEETGKGLYATFSTVSYNKDKKVVTFHDIVVKNGDDETTVKRPAYSIRVITSDGDVYKGKWDQTGD